MLTRLGFGVARSSFDLCHPAMGRGSISSCREPWPSCPQQPEPQLKISCVVVSASVCRAPHAIADTWNCAPRDRMSREPALSPHEAADRLMSWALPTPGPTWSAADPGMGSGRARLPSPELLSGGCAGGLAAGVLPLGLASLRRRRS